MKDTIYFESKTRVLQGNGSLYPQDNTIFNKNTKDDIHLVCLKDALDNYMDYTK